MVGKPGRSGRKRVVTTTGGTQTSGRGIYGYKKRYFRPNRMSLALQPQNTVKKMRYVEYRAETVSAGTVGHWAIKANDIFDPNHTGVGHQPNGYDLYSQLYNHYLVTGAKITAFIWSETSANYGAVGGIVLSDDSTISATNITNIMEQEHNRFTMFRYEPSGDRSIAKITKKFSARKFFDLKDPKDGKESYGASFGSSPAEYATFNIWYGHPSTNLEQTFHVMVVVEYIAQLSEPKELVQS